MPLKLLTDLIDQAGIGCLIIVLLRGLQAHEDHRILLLMLAELFAAVRDGQTVKEITVIDFFALFGDFIFKEAPDHKLIERLAEAARPGKQRDLGIALDQLLDHKGFVDKIAVPVDQRFEILYADRDFLLLLFVFHTPGFLSLLRFYAYTCTASLAIVYLIR